jgi:hypothetical protein
MCVLHYHHDYTRHEGGSSDGLFTWKVWVGLSVVLVLAVLIDSWCSRRGKLAGKRNRRNPEANGQILRNSSGTKKADTVVL